MNALASSVNVLGLYGQNCPCRFTYLCVKEPVNQQRGTSLAAFPASDTVSRFRDWQVSLCQNAMRKGEIFRGEVAISVAKSSSRCWIGDGAMSEFQKVNPAIAAMMPGAIGSPIS
jgi:hypothetical protein